MLFLHREAVACNGHSIGNERLVLLYSLIDRERGSDILDNGANADREAAGLHLTLHYGVNELFLTALRILFLKRKYLDIRIFEL